MFQHYPHLYRLRGIFQLLEELRCLPHWKRRRTDHHRHHRPASFQKRSDRTSNRLRAIYEALVNRDVLTGGSIFRLPLVSSASFSTWSGSNVDRSVWCTLQEDGMLSVRFCSSLGTAEHKEFSDTVPSVRSCLVEYRGALPPVDMKGL